MAGTIVVGTISDGTNSSSTSSVVSGGAKAWANFNGATGATRATFNVTSVTRNGTGDYTVNFTTAFTDANYVLAGFCAFNLGNTAPAAMLTYGGDFAPATTSCRIKCANSTNAGVTDGAYVTVAFFR
jgi:hypothetical protein